MTEQFVPVTAWPYRGLSPENLERELESEVNAHRSKRGVDKLVADSNLAAACRLHAERMRDGSFFAHIDPRNGSGPLERLEAIDRRRWSPVAENIAAGQWTAEQVLEGWLGSSGHRANLERGDVGMVGTGVALGGEHHTYFVQIYAMPYGVPVESPAAESGYQKPSIGRAVGVRTSASQGRWR